MLCLHAQSLSCVWLFTAPQYSPMVCQAPLSMEFPGKNTGVGCHFLLQGIFPTQGSNLNLLYNYSSISKPKKFDVIAQPEKNLPSMQETWVQVQSLGWEDPLEEEMATHSSILAWRIPWTEEPVGYRSWGCKESDATESLTLSLCNWQRPYW